MVCPYAESVNVYSNKKNDFKYIHIELIEY